MAYNGSGFGGVVQPFVREGIIEYSQNLPSSQWNFGQPNFINPNPYGPSGPNPVDIGVTINNLGGMLRESRILATANNQALDRIMLGYQM